MLGLAQGRDLCEQNYNDVECSVKCKNHDVDTRHAR